MDLLAHTCPDHGPFILNEEEFGGCPVQVDYDGITCGKRGKPVEYVRADLHRGAVEALEHIGARLHDVPGPEAAALVAEIGETLDRLRGQ